jgi:hypothetical protein
LRNGSEERNEFSVTILKWSTSLFASVKPTDKEHNDLITCQKKFGHVDMHREFALNLWAGKQTKPILYNIYKVLKLLKMCFERKKLCSIALSLFALYGWPVFRKNDNRMSY